MDKRTTEREAVAELRDGMTIGIGGWGSRRKPMSIVREILNLHGCRVRAESRPGEGTAIRFTLPLAAESPPREEPPKAPAPETDAATDDDGSETPGDDPSSTESGASDDDSPQPRFRVIRRYRRR